MRKKSHISLAGYLVREMRLEELLEHKKAFYLGSILPDLTPKMFAEPHNFMTSYEKLREDMEQIAEHGAGGGYKERVIWRNIGVVMHYLADYFTFPHNSTYDGNLKDHCLYERDLKYWLRGFVRTPEAMMIFREQRMVVRHITSLSELFVSIEQMHEAYLAGDHTVEDDCRWIVAMCSRALLYFASVLGAQGAGKPVSLCAA